MHIRDFNIKSLGACTARRDLHDHDVDDVCLNVFELCE